MKKALFIIAITLNLGACGISYLISDGKKAEEAYKAIRDKLTWEQKCAKLSEIADLYYKENFRNSFERINSEKKVVCGINRLNELNKELQSM